MFGLGSKFRNNSRAYLIKLDGLGPVDSRPSTE